jgi:hypothetical protein
MRWMFEVIAGDVGMGWIMGGFKRMMGIFKVMDNNID